MIFSSLTIHKGMLASCKLYGSFYYSLHGKSLILHWIIKDNSYQPALSLHYIFFHASSNFYKATTCYPFHCSNQPPTTCYPRTRLASKLLCYYQWTWMYVQRGQRMANWQSKQLHGDSCIWSMSLYKSMVQHLL